MLKIIPRIHVFFYRLSGGRFGSQMRGFQLLLLTTIGRKSGKHRTTPLGFFKDGENFVIIGSGGQDNHPAWYYNLKSNPTATIQVKDKQMTVLAEGVGPEERQRLWAELMAVAPGYADYQKRTSREIPLVILKP